MHCFYSLCTVVVFYCVLIGHLVYFGIMRYTCLTYRTIIIFIPQQPLPVTVSLFLTFSTVLKLFDIQIVCNIVQVKVAVVALANTRGLLVSEDFHKRKAFDLFDWLQHYFGFQVSRYVSVIILILPF